METNCTRRSVSTVVVAGADAAQQRFLVRQAEAFAGRVLKEIAGRPRPRRGAAGLRPAADRARSRRCWKSSCADQAARHGGAGRRTPALADLCQMLLSANELCTSIDRGDRADDMDYTVTPGTDQPQLGGGLGGWPWRRCSPRRTPPLPPSEPARPARNRTTRPRRRRSSSCSCTAGRATSICSIPSRCSRSTTARRRRPRSPTTRSSPATCSEPVQVRASTASRAWSSRRRCRSIAGHADDIAVIRSMYTEHRNHEQALWMMHTGLTVAGRPSLGAWAAYGLGTENQNLPAYVVLPDPSGLPVDGIRNWSSGWMPPLYQGTPFRSEGHAGAEPAAAHAATGRASRRAGWSLLAELNADHRAAPPRRAGTRRPHRQLRAGRPDAAVRHRRARPVARRAGQGAAALRPRQPDDAAYGSAA